jgi:hypothetical protein
MKKTTFKETDATYEDKLAMIMAVGDATIEEASRALAECNGDVDGAMTIVYDQAPPPSNDYASSSSSSLHNAPYKPTRKARHSEDVNDESIAKPSEWLRHAPTLVARRRPVIAAAAAAAASPKGPKENGKKNVLNLYCLLNTTSHEYFFSVSCAASADDNISLHCVSQPKCWYCKSNNDESNPFSRFIIKCSRSICHWWCE